MKKINHTAKELFNILKLNIDIFLYYDEKELDKIWPLTLPGPLDELVSWVKIYADKNIYKTPYDYQQLIEKNCELNDNERNIMLVMISTAMKRAGLENWEI